MLVSPTLQSGRLDEENIRVKVLLETFHISAPISSQFIQLLVELKAIPVINILGPSSHSTQGNTMKNYERVGDAMVLPIDMSPLENPMISDPVSRRSHEPNISQNSCFHFVLTRKVSVSFGKMFLTK